MSDEASNDPLREPRSHLIAAPSASDSRARLNARCGNAVYRLLSAQLNLRGDGSLYVSFARAGDTDSSVKIRLSKSGVSVSEPENQKKGFRLSYHPTGLLNFHHISAGSVQMEPLAAITRREPLIDISIPDVSRLDPEDGPTEDASVVDLPPGRITLTLVIDHANAAVHETDVWAWTWAPAFSLRACVSTLPEKVSSSIPDTLSEHFHYFARSVGVNGARPRNSQNLDCAVDPR